MQLIDQIPKDAIALLFCYLMHWHFQGHCTNTYIGGYMITKPPYIQFQLKNLCTSLKCQGIPGGSDTECIWTGSRTKLPS